MHGLPVNLILWDSYYVRRFASAWYMCSPLKLVELNNMALSHNKTWRSRQT